MNRDKIKQAAAIGVAAWILGFAGVMLFKEFHGFSLAVVIAVCLGAPIPIWFVSFRFLKAIPERSLTAPALAFSGILLGVQFFLDGLFAASIFLFDLPHLDVSAVKAVFLALEIGYFFFLSIPFLTSQQIKTSKGDG